MALTRRAGREARGASHGRAGGVSAHAFNSGHALTRRERLRPLARSATTGRWCLEAQHDLRADRSGINVSFQRRYLVAPGHRAHGAREREFRSRFLRQEIARVTPSRIGHLGSLSFDFARHACQRRGGSAGVCKQGGRGRWPASRHGQRRPRIAPWGAADGIAGGVGWFKKAAETSFALCALTSHAYCHL